MKVMIQARSRSSHKRALSIAIMVLLIFLGLPPLQAAAAVPAAPTITAITTGNGQLSAAFTAGSDGGSAITIYQYSTDNGTSWLDRQDGGTTASPLVITRLSADGTTRLVNGTTYQVSSEEPSVSGEGDGLVGGAEVSHNSARIAAARVIESCGA